MPKVSRKTVAPVVARDFVSEVDAGKMKEAATRVKSLVESNGHPEPTDNQLMVWSACSLVPKGQVASYGTISKLIQKVRGEDYSHPKYARMVGKLLSQNPVAPIVPCHRVVGGNGRLVGFEGGTCNIGKKLELLQKEGVVFTTAGNVATVAAANVL